MRHLRLCILLALVLFPWTSAPAQEVGADVASEAIEQVAPEFLSARLHVTSVNRIGEETRTFRFRRMDRKVLMVADQTDKGRFTPETYYDYDRREYFLKLESDDIVFSYRITDRDMAQAQIYGWIPTPDQADRFRLVVNENLTFDGHPCTLALVGYNTPGGGVLALHWVWEARDLDGEVVRVVFPEAPGRQVIVEYFDVHTDAFREDEVLPPAGLPVLSGF